MEKLKHLCTVSGNVSSTTGSYYLMVLEAQSPKARCSEGHEGGPDSGLSPSLWRADFTWSFLFAGLCVQISPSLKDTRAHPSDLILMNYICHDPIPSKITSWDLGVRISTYASWVWWGTIQLIALRPSLWNPEGQAVMTKDQHDEGLSWSCMALLSQEPIPQPHPLGSVLPGGGMWATLVALATISQVFCILRSYRTSGSLLMSWMLVFWSWQCPNWAMEKYWGFYISKLWWKENSWRFKFRTSELSKHPPPQFINCPLLLVGICCFFEQLSFHLPSLSKNILPLWGNFLSLPCSVLLGLEVQVFGETSQGQVLMWDSGQAHRTVFPRVMQGWKCAQIFFLAAELSVRSFPACNASLHLESMWAPIDFQYPFLLNLPGFCFCCVAKQPSLILGLCCNSKE